jgi:hypothetical protein
MPHGIGVGAKARKCLHHRRSQTCIRISGDACRVRLDADAVTAAPKVGDLSTDARQGAGQRATYNPLRYHIAV